MRGIDGEQITCLIVRVRQRPLQRCLGEESVAVVVCIGRRAARIDRQLIRDAPEHFTCSFVREREQQNISRIDPVLEQVRHAICEGPCFS